MSGGPVTNVPTTGALASFVLGVAVTVTAAYIFLALILVPALIQVGFALMSVHMFLLYRGMLSFIIPPVALAALAAASVARCEPMQTGLDAMRIGTVIYFSPFFFVLNPALLLQGAAGEIVVVIAWLAGGRRAAPLIAQVDIKTCGL